MPSRRNLKVLRSGFFIRFFSVGVGFKGPGLQRDSGAGRISVQGDLTAQRSILGFQVNGATQFFDPGGYFADRLRSVRVKCDTVLPCHRSAFLDGLDRADLVVGMHDGDEDGLGGDGSSDCRGISFSWASAATSS